MTQTRVEDLVVTYGGTTAVAGITFEVGPSELVALVGGDGAGKTTVLRALGGAIAPTRGRVVNPGVRNTGIVSGDSGVYRDLTTEENLDFSGRAYGLRGAQLRNRIELLLTAAELVEARHRLSGALSGGMRQKLALAMALVHEPRLLLLDEATTGVDPVSRGELWREIARAAAGGTAVVFATTYLDEAERASHVIALEAGRVLVAGSPDAIVASIPGRVTETRNRPAGRFSYRRGARFRTWDPSGRRGDPIRPDLQDAVTIAALKAHSERRAA